jgi:hypothetical protein
MHVIFCSIMGAFIFAQIVKETGIPITLRNESLTNAPTLLGVVLKAQVDKRYLSQQHRFFEK